MGHRGADPLGLYRPLTGARIETSALQAVDFAAAHRPLTGARIETLGDQPLLMTPADRPLTGARIETVKAAGAPRPLPSPPHGGAD